MNNWSRLCFVCITLGFFMLSQVSLRAQLTTDADFKRQVYDKDYSVGLLLHTRGFGVTGRYGILTSGFSKNAIEFDIVNMRHPKENRTFTDLLSNSTGFVFGRLNGFYVVRTGYHRERIMYDKTDQGTLSASWFYSLGISWGLLKPVYLEIEDFETRVVRVERYDPQSTEGFVRGQARFSKGLGETQIRPGIYLKSGFSIDNHEADNRIRSLEMGVIIDAYSSEIPIMHDTSNNQFFFQLYMAINFGRKWN